MLTTFVLIFGLASVDPAKADAAVEANLELLKVSYFCGGGGSGAYRSAKEAAVRAIRMHSESKYKVTDLTELDRRLSRGEIDLPYDKADCDNLLLEAKERVRSR